MAQKSGKKLFLLRRIHMDHDVLDLGMLPLDLVMDLLGYDYELNLYKLVLRACGK